MISISGSKSWKICVLIQPDQEFMVKMKIISICYILYLNTNQDRSIRRALKIKALLWVQTLVDFLGGEGSRKHYYIEHLKTQPIFRARKYYVMVKQTDTGALDSGHWQVN